MTERQPWRLRIRFSLDLGRRRAPEPATPAPAVQHEHRDGFSQVEQSYQRPAGFEIPTGE